MPSTTTISPIETYQDHFPWLEPKEKNGALHYCFGSIEQAEKAYKMSLKTILKHKLPLMVKLTVTWLNAYCFDINMVVKPVPEEEMILDEVPGEVMEPDWWGGSERGDE